MSVVPGKLPVPRHWLLDANVLFSEWMRWLMVVLAQYHRATLYWTPQIENECFRNLVRLGRVHPDDAQLERSSLPARMNAVLLAQSHEPYLLDVCFVDEKDRHVAASALVLRHGAQSPVGLLTWNLRDFPRKSLLKLSLVRFSPDELCLELLREGGQILPYLQESIELMRTALLTHHPQYPTDYQSKSFTLPSNIDQWLAFLGRNRMYRTAQALCRQQ